MVWETENAEQGKERTKSTGGGGRSGRGTLVTVQCITQGLGGNGLSPSSSVPPCMSRSRWAAANWRWPRTCTCQSQRCKAPHRGILESANHQNHARKLAKSACTEDQHRARRWQRTFSIKAAAVVSSAAVKVKFDSPDTNLTVTSCCCAPLADICVQIASESCRQIDLTLTLSSRDAAWRRAWPMRCVLVRQQWRFPRRIMSTPRRAKLRNPLAA